MKTKVVSIIPARSGSKSVPNKNIFNLGGVPLIAHTIKCSRECETINETYVSTDSQHYGDIAQSFGAVVPFLRPPELSSDTSNDLSFVSHFLEWFQYDKGYFPDFLVHLRPTTPMRKSLVVDNAVQLFSNASRDYTSLRSAHESPESAYKQFEIDSENNAFVSVFTRCRDLDGFNEGRQSFRPTYHPNGYVDVLSVEFILKNKKLHGDKVYPFITEYSHEVDSLSDLQILQSLIGQG